MFFGSPLGAPTAATLNCTMWTGSTISDSSCSGIEGNAELDSGQNTEFRSYVGFDWFRYDDLEQPNVTLIYPPDETVNNINSYNFTWTVTDDCGNSATCEQTITIIDDTPRRDPPGGSQP